MLITLDITLLSLSFFLWSLCYIFIYDFFAENDILDM